MVGLSELLETMDNRTYVDIYAPSRDCPIELKSIFSDTALVAYAERRGKLEKAWSHMVKNMSICYDVSDENNCKPVVKLILSRHV